MPAQVRSVGASNSGSATATAFSPTMPVGFAAGDLLVAVVNGSNGTAPTSPAGWTLLRNIADGTAFHMQIMTKTAAGGETPQWTIGTARKWAAAVAAITAGSWDTGTTWDVENGAAKGATASTAYASPSVTVATADCLLLAAFGCQGASTWTCTDTNPAMAEGADTTATGTTPASIGLYHSSTNVVPTGAVTRTGTGSVSSANACMWVGAIRPTGAGGVGGILNWWARPHRAQRMAPRQPIG